ncbi:MAG: transcriptional repressor LexA [Oscillospiraceae bacterium]|nr:transcriptional repressor LexA [Oscillospiraceae bacterium]
MRKRKEEKIKEIIDFVNNEVTLKGYPPSVREICAAVGFKSTSTVHGYLERLSREGLLKKDPLKPRALKVMVDPASGRAEPAPGIRRQAGPMARPNEQILGDGYMHFNEVVDVPLLGVVNAGQPILAHEDMESVYSLPTDFARGKDVFMLRVKGDSMVEAGILDGDYIVVRKQEDAENGEIIVGMLGDEATVKKYYLEKGRIRLQPENPSMDPIYVNLGDDFRVVGKVISLLRLVR